ncbi:hypothetical protein FGO68_gene14174 [Halteria grandinella]|uniref:Uncharacterized protein n=1 Tax=Halteria grandinella TaxID=5974 RepID=A0A8J8NPR9_HALGN|nr:hypothetical protein FGO68_gene14174 [Halteria grandinella]
MTTNYNQPLSSTTQPQLTTQNLMGQTEKYISGQTQNLATNILPTNQSQGYYQEQQQPLKTTQYSGTTSNIQQQPFQTTASSFGTDSGFSTSTYTASSNVPVTSSTQEYISGAGCPATQGYTTSSNIIGGGVGGGYINEGLTTTAATTQVYQLPTTTSTTILAPAMGASTLRGGVIGPNTHGVPENYPLIPADLGCKKCHGTGYKKTMLTRKWKPCKRCASEYGTDVSAINLHNLQPYSSTGYGGASNTGMPLGATSAMPLGTTTAMPLQTGSTMLGMTASGAGVTQAYPTQINY